MSIIKCDMCQKSTSSRELELLFYGEWMTKNDITVHYFCLLLSTNLPQNGTDNAGILGFQINDIRKEMRICKSRKCKYCLEMCATIMCKICKKYFHLTCGHTNKCLFEFVDQFQSYCGACVPTNKTLKSILKRNPPDDNQRCYICMQEMGVFVPTRWIYAKCCYNGYAHTKCMMEYALSSGYYLCCIWCKSKRFREDVKYRGVFVPDRDANWEKEKGAYQDLYRVHKRCDMEMCNCPKGRDFNSNKWQIITCKFCGAFGTHNPGCIPGFEDSKEKITEFRCDSCSIIEKTMCYNKSIPADSGNTLNTNSDCINTSLYINKETTRLTQKQSTESIDFSEDESLSSVETVINYKILQNKLPKQTQNETTTMSQVPDQIIASSSVYNLTECPIEVMQIDEIDPDNGVVKPETNPSNANVIQEKTENREPVNVSKLDGSKENTNTNQTNDNVILEKTESVNGEQLTEFESFSEINENNNKSENNEKINDQVKENDIEMMSSDLATNFESVENQENNNYLIKKPFNESNLAEITENTKEISKRVNGEHITELENFSEIKDYNKGSENTKIFIDKSSGSNLEMLQNKSATSCKTDEIQKNVELYKIENDDVVYRELSDSEIDYLVESMDVFGDNYDEIFENTDTSYSKSATFNSQNISDHTLLRELTDSEINAVVDILDSW